MDKYEYKLRTEQMLEFMDEGAYRKAAEIADTIDWHRVKNVSMLASVGDIYEKTGEYSKSYDVLKIVYDRADGSRKIVYKLGLLALRLRNVDEALDYYEEFVQVAPKDPNQYILRYKILRARRAPIEQQIEALEEFKKAEYIEKWAYELAKLYQEAGMTAECLEECDDLILWFSEGEYVFKAMELKMQYKPLTPSQQEKYDHRFEYEEDPGYEDDEDLAEPVKEDPIPVAREVAPTATSEDMPELTEEASEAYEPEEAEVDLEEAEPEEFEEDGSEEPEEVAEQKPERKKPSIGTNMSLEEALSGIVRGQKKQEEMLQAETKQIPEVEEVLKEAEAQRAEVVAAVEAEELKENPDTPESEEEVEIAEPKKIAEEKAEPVETPVDDDQIEGQMSLEDILNGWETAASQESESEEAEPAAQEDAILEAIDSAEEQAEELLLSDEDAEAFEEYDDSEEDVEDYEEEEEYDDSEEDVEDYEEEEYDESEEDAEEDVEEYEEEEEYDESEEDVEDYEEEEEYDDSEEDVEDYEEEEYDDFDEDAEEDVEEYEEEEEYDESEEDAEEYEEEEEYDESEEDAEEYEEEEEYDDFEEDAEEYEEEEEYDDFDEDAEDYEEATDYDGFEDYEEDYDEEEYDVFDSDLRELTPDGKKKKATVKKKPEAKKKPVLDDREIEDDDDFPDLLASTAPLSRKETAKLIATGKTAPLPLDEISNALSMSDTGFIVHGRYDLETQSGVGTRAGLTEEQKKLFSYFVPVRGMSEQLVDVLEQDKNCTNRQGTSRTGNLLIIGRKGSGKTVLAVDVVKAIQKERRIKQGKVAIVSGDSLNKKKMSDIFQKLYGGALIIEKAGKMNERTVAKLNKAMEGDTGEMLIVLEEQRKPLDRLLSSNREFRRKFTSRLEVPIFINDELVTFGQTYARENGYKIDEMGILALYSRIDALQREDHAVTVAEVKEVMDDAIAHSQKSSAKRLVKRVFGRGTDSSDRIILSEKDFNI